MHKKSIFKQQLILYMGIMLAGFILMAIILSMIYINYYIQQKENQLIEQGEKISKKVLEMYATNYLTGTFSLKSINSQLEVIEEYMDTSVFFLNSDGVISSATKGIDQSWVGQTFTDVAINGVLEGKIVTIEGKINGMFSEQVLTVGYPIIIGNKIIGGIFMCTSMPEIQKSMNGLYTAFAVSLICVLIIGFFMIYYFSGKISSPILKMTEAVKVIASGDFEKRIEINTNNEIAELAESFNDMAESLNNQEKTRRNFIANVSHDLRSPLTSIQGFLNAILDGTIPKEKQDHYIQIVLEETMRLTKLANDILDLNGAQESKLTLEKTVFNINELIKDTLDRLEPRFKEKNIEVKVLFEEKETFVSADPDKIARVFHNIVDNAIKFTDRYGFIKIETTLSDDKKVIVSVKDNGEGISEDDKKYVFDRFYKADTSRGKDKKGGGLGLSIAKEFILAHGEKIGVKSEEGNGAEFIFTLSVADNKF